MKGKSKNKGLTGIKGTIKGRTELPSGITQFVVKGDAQTFTQTGDIVPKRKAAFDSL